MVETITDPEQLEDPRVNMILHVEDFLSHKLYLLRTGLLAFCVFVNISMRDENANVWSYLLFMLCNSMVYSMIFNSYEVELLRANELSKTSLKELVRGVWTSFVVWATYLFLGASCPAFIISVWYEINAGMLIELVSSNHLMTISLLSVNMATTLLVMILHRVSWGIIVSTGSVLVIVQMVLVCISTVVKKVTFCEKELRKTMLTSLVYYKRLYWYAPSLHISISKSGTILDCNCGLVDLTGYSREHLSTMKIYDLFDYDSSKFLKTLYQQETYHDLNHVELRMPLKDGQIRYMVAFITFDNPSDSSFISNMILYDLTENKRLFQEVQEEKKKAISQLYFLAHEFRTPLTAIIAHSELLSEANCISADMEESISSIRNCSQHLRVLVSDILDMASIKNLKLQLQLQEINLSQLIRNIQSALAPIASLKQLTMRCEIHPRLKETQFIGDEPRLNQILTNLVGNAIKYTDKGTVSVRVCSCSDCLSYVLKEKLVSWQTRLDGRSLLIFQIQDTGKGIPKEKMDFVFQEFSQFHDMPNGTSSGLGLYISKQLVELMDGTILVESEWAKGSNFCVIIPLQPISPSNSTAELPGPTAPLELVDVKSLKVLIAEDSRICQQCLVKMLVHLGVPTDNITLTSDGCSALQEFNNAVHSAHRFNLVLMDLSLPKEDGLSVTRKIRAMDPAIRVVVVSGDANPCLRSICIDAGASDVCAKPFTLSQIRKVIGQSV